MFLSAFAPVFSAIAALPGAAGAEFAVSPLRQVITRQNPVGVYEISNGSDRILDARIGWIDLSATEYGYAEATPAARPALSAAPYLVVSPARLRLEPGKRAKVAVRLKKGARPPPGERRSHLLIETTPVRTPLRRAGGGLEADVELGVSTPVIVRTGFAPPAVSITQTRLVRDADGMLELDTTLSRTGRYSAFGRLTVVMTAEGRPRRLAEIANIPIHFDAAARRLRVPLNAGALPAGVLELRYIGAAEYEGRVFAEKKFEIAPPD
ncbi:MAG: hypothetical protein HXY21_13880 [Parvularculaceae bacterium]|nr:hypothetical protein [Parvularculaceae bacterium]